MRRIRCLLYVLFAVVTMAMVSPTYLGAQADRGAIKGSTEDTSRKPAFPVPGLR